MKAFMDKRLDCFCIGASPGDGLLTQPVHNSIKNLLAPSLVTVKVKYQLSDFYRCVIRRICKFDPGHFFNCRDDMFPVLLKIDRGRDSTERRASGRST